MPTESINKIRIKKKNGEIADFDDTKIVNSIKYALKKAGLKDNPVSDEIKEEVLARLEQIKKFKGEISTDDVKDEVEILLIENNLTQVAQQYIKFRRDKKLEGRRSDEVPNLTGRGLIFSRKFTEAGAHPFNKIEWEKRNAQIMNDKGEVVFEQRDVEVPKSWSQSATNIVVSKYFWGQVGNPERETSVKQLVSRVAKTISNWGRAQGYFKTAESADTFEDELTYILANQVAAFNSPVWFNVGTAEQPQSSACFINSIQDDMRSILSLAVTEGMLFKYGSGTGTNLSVLRSSKEPLSGSSGRASGPVSFMKGFDAFSGVIKSGGRTRRAAKMVILNIDHPDIEEFINCKSKEEKKAHHLVAAGYDSSIDGEAYSSIFFQNANNSVRVTDDFMKQVEKGGEWQTHYITTGQVADTYQARDLFRQIADNAWLCGDPGLQFDTTINRWHTCPNSGRINASNPCVEFMFLDNSACNLSSINLLKFLGKDNQFDIEGFKYTVDIMITAQEIIVDNSSYPTPAIEKNSHDFRPLGLGYTNLGAFLMSLGMAYDSEEGRNLAATVTSLMTGEAYFQSARLAKELGPFKYFSKNREPFLRVIGMHQDYMGRLRREGVPDALNQEAIRVWDHAYETGSKYGFRNAQTTLLAPTGTISFLMDCDTTGIEPDIALVKYKWLVGGGMMKLINQSVPRALEILGYSPSEKEEILKFLDKNDTIEGAPHFKEEHLPIFDCAFKPANGERSILHMAHLKMTASVQPFLSGAISKTVNMSNEAAAEEIEEVYLSAWRMGIKAVSIYRDGCKKTQPLTVTAKNGAGREEGSGPPQRARRVRMPDERNSITHKFTISGHEGYINVGLYEDGSPGEIFVRMSKQGSVISGLMDAFATSVSIALQYGVPLDVLVNKFVHSRFEPSGFTNNPNIRIAKSIVDYIFRWLALKFLPEEELTQVGVNQTNGKTDDFEQKLPLVQKPEAKKELKTKGLKPQLGQAPALRSEQANTRVIFDVQADAPPCDNCGAIMVRNATCYKCLNCGNTSGCS